MSIKQHQLLAAESDIISQKNEILDETIKMFSTNSKFDEFSRTYHAFNENDKDIPEKETKSMVTTVEERLKYTSKYLIKYIDTLVSKETTNTVAKADIVIKKDELEEVIAKDVPVSALLQLEKEVGRLKNMFTTIPTINSEIEWVIDENNNGQKCYKISEPVKTVRKRVETQIKEINPNPLPNSDKYKLDFKEIKVENPVGEYTKISKSGALKSSNKADIIERFNDILTAIKAARAKANETEVVHNNVGKEIFKYILEQ